MTPDTLKEIEEINHKLDDIEQFVDNLGHSNGIPREVETAFIERLSSVFMAAVTKAGDMGSTSFTDVGAVFSQAILNTNFALAATQLNAIRTALRSANLMS